MNKANCFELQLNDYYVLISYSTPVAYFDRQKNLFFKTNKFFSKTTSRHINEWLKQRNADFWGDVDQAFLDGLIKVQNVSKGGQ